MEKKECPKLSKEAGSVLIDFFIKLREKAASKKSLTPITLRQYEELLRLSESIAKTKQHATVTKEDALEAINR